MEASRLLLVTCLLVQNNVIRLDLIHVSRDQLSKDSKDCGSKYRPCASIQHAVNISSDSDTILLDINSEFHQNETLMIDKSINITSYSSGGLDTNLSSTIIFYGLDVNDAAFQLSVSISLSRLNIQSLVTLFGVAVGARGYTEITDCHIIPDNGVISIYKFDVTNRSWRFHFHSVVFNGSNSLPTTTANHRTIELGKTIVSVKFQTCTLLNTEIDAYDQSGGERSFVFTGSNFFKSTIFARKAKEIVIHNCTLHSSTIEAVNTKVKITKTIFDNSMPSSNPLKQLQMENGQSLTIDRCTFRNAKWGSVFALNVVSIVIQNTVFHDNSARISVLGEQGVVLILGSFRNVELQECRFLDNASPRTESSDLYIKGNPLGDNAVTIRHTVLYHGEDPFPSAREKAVLFISSQAIHFHNVTMGCPANFYELYNHDTNLLEDPYSFFTCVRCDGTSYSVNTRANITFDKDYSIIAHRYNNTCHPCPYQASCIDKIRCKGNYWGHPTVNGAVKFIPCPSSYCCSSLNTCKSYDTCANNRKGRLCGNCLNDHSISILGPNRCVLTEHCNVPIFWVAYILAVAAVCIFVMYIKQLIAFIKSVFSKKCQRDPDTNADTVSVTTSADGNSLLQDSVSSSRSQEQSNISGIIKISFFFYQTASIIRIQASAKSAYAMPYIMDAITSFFNVKIDIYSSSTTGLDVCPLHTSNVIVIEAFRISLVLVCLLLFVLMIVVTFCITKCCTKSDEHDKLQTSSEDQRQPNITLLIQLKGACIQLLLLGYSVIALFCLQAVHCIEIGDGLYLYLQADSVKCYQYWQKITLGIIGVWAVPFPISIYVGCRLLRTRKVTANEFLLMLTFPPAAILYLMMIWRRRKQNLLKLNDTRSTEADHLLSILNEPFRSVDKNTTFQIIWEPVLIFRRFALIVVTTFIQSPVEKLYPVGVFLVICTLQDVFVQPYLSDSLNPIQFVSMLLLGLLTLINLFWSFSNDIDISQHANPMYFNLRKVFLYLEMSILLLPLSIFVLTILYRFGKFLYKAISGKQD